MTIADSVPKGRGSLRFARVVWAIGILVIAAVVASTTFTYMLGVEALSDGGFRHTGER